MDILETYIKQCEKATEIQEAKRDINTPGDIWAHPKLEDTELGYSVVILGSVYDRLGYRYPTSVWLPRQEDLQKMVGTYEVCKNTIFSAGYGDNEYSGYWDMDASYWDKFTSMEQLWLAYVMKEKYGKVWQNGEWESHFPIILLYQ